MGGNLLAEDNNGTWMDYVWLNGRLVTVIANGGVLSLHNDQTGRPQVMTDPVSTNIDWAARNLAFDRTVTTNALGGPFNIGFPGQYNDTEDALWYNGARDYDSTLGRYIESDPIGLGGGINTYAYAGNNPITGIDPLGLRVDHGIPPGSVLYESPNGGGPFWAPASANWSAVYASGQANSITSIGHFVGQGGQFDYQRNGSTNYSAYIDSANYAVGVWAAGNGLSEGGMSFLGNMYSRLFSSNPLDPAQQDFWALGWQDATQDTFAIPFLYTLSTPGDNCPG